MTYVVKAQLVQAKLDHGGYVHLYQGAPLPDNMDPEQLEQLIETDMVGDPDAPAEEPEESQAPGAPKGNASREEWAAYASSKGASSDETKPVEEGGLKQAELREKYGN
jgi:hypothetical protein